MFENPKTTILGFLTAFFAFVFFSPETFKAVPWLVELSKFAVVGGLAGLGIVAVDFKKPTPPSPPQDTPVFPGHLLSK